MIKMSIETGRGTSANDKNFITVTSGPVATESLTNNIKVVPNPYIVTSAFQEDVNGNRLKFTPLPNNCKITIYTISGEIVDVINHSSGGTAWWGLKNQKGYDVAPGLYIFRVETENELDFIGKFAIIR